MSIKQTWYTAYRKARTGKASKDPLVLLARTMRYPLKPKPAPIDRLAARRKEREALLQTNERLVGDSMSALSLREVFNTQSSYLAVANAALRHAVDNKELFTRESVYELLNRLGVDVTGVRL